MSTVEPIRRKSDLKRIEGALKRKDVRNFVLFKIGINCGLRISDILALDVGDVKNKNFIQIIEQKTGKQRKIPINKVLKEILDEYTKNKAGNSPLFISKITKTRLDRFMAYRIITKACAEAKIEGNIGTHTLRKTFGYHYYKKYKDVAMLQKIFNHSSPVITLRYIGITQDEVYKSYMKFAL